MLGRVIVYAGGNIVCRHSVAALFTDDAKTNGFYKLCRLNASGTTVNARQSMKDIYKRKAISSEFRYRRFRPYKRTDEDGIPFRHRTDRLRSIFRSAYTFWGLHRLCGEPVRAKALFYSASLSSFTPSASASSSVKYITGTGLPFLTRLYLQSGQAVTISSAP